MKSEKNEKTKASVLRKNRLNPRPRSHHRLIKDPLSVQNKKFYNQAFYFLKGYPRKGDLQYFKKHWFSLVPQTENDRKSQNSLTSSVESEEMIEKEKMQFIKRCWEIWICGFIEIWRRQILFNRIALLSFSGTSPIVSSTWVFPVHFWFAYKFGSLNPRELTHIPIPTWMIAVSEIIESVNRESSRLFKYLEFVDPDSKKTIQIEADQPPEFETMDYMNAIPKIQKSTKHISLCIELIVQLLPFDLGETSFMIKDEIDSMGELPYGFDFTRLMRAILIVLCSSNIALKRKEIQDKVRKKFGTERLAITGGSSFNKALKAMKNKGFVVSYSGPKEDPKGHNYKVNQRYFRQFSKLRLD